MLFKTDIWEKFYDVEKEVLVENVSKYEINEVTKDGYLKLLLNILGAYDTAKNEIYYDVAVVVADRLLNIDPDDYFF